MIAVVKKQDVQTVIKINTTSWKNKDEKGVEKKQQESKTVESVRRVCLSCLCGMTSLWTAAVFVNQGRPVVFVGLFLMKETKEEMHEWEKE